MVTEPKRKVLVERLIMVLLGISVAVLVLVVKPECQSNSPPGTTPPPIHTPPSSYAVETYVYPSVVVTPVSQYAGDKVKVLGCGFGGFGKEGETLILYLGNNEVGEVTTNEFGAFVTEVTISEEITPGVYPLMAVPEESLLPIGHGSPLEILEPSPK